MSKILKKSFLWFIVIVGASVVTFGVQRFTPLAHDLQPVSCCQQAVLANPSLQWLYLAFVAERTTLGYESKRWRRDFVLAIEKRRAKRQARLALKTATQSLLPLALLRGGAR